MFDQIETRDRIREEVNRIFSESDNPNRDCSVFVNEQGGFFILFKAGYMTYDEARKLQDYLLTPLGLDIAWAVDSKTMNSRIDIRERPRERVVSETRIHLGDRSKDRGTVPHSPIHHLVHPHYGEGRGRPKGALGKPVEHPYNKAEIVNIGDEYAIVRVNGKNAYAYREEHIYDSSTLSGKRKKSKWYMYVMNMDAKVKVLERIEAGNLNALVRYIQRDKRPLKAT